MAAITQQEWNRCWRVFVLQCETNTEKCKKKLWKILMLKIIKVNSFSWGDKRILRRKHFSKWIKGLKKLKGLLLSFLPVRLEADSHLSVDYYFTWAAHFGLTSSPMCLTVESVGQKNSRLIINHYSSFVLPPLCRQSTIIREPEFSSSI